MSGAAVLRRAGVPDAPLQRLEGGDVSTVERCGDWVVKTRRGADGGLFTSEARGLRLLEERGCRVPEVRHVDSDGIVLRYLPPGPADWPDLATQLARLHTRREATYGLDAPVYIGPIGLPACEGDAVGVWRDARMVPVIARCRGLGPLRARLDTLLEQGTPPLEGPVVIHGDLWGGNVHMSEAGAALIDPSAWRGERAVDLAMMTLFGGFPAAFWDAYEALAPIPQEVRDALPYWRLYFVLVHVALFGAGYLGSVERELDALRSSGGLRA